MDSTTLGDKTVKMERGCHKRWSEHGKDGEEALPSLRTWFPGVRTSGQKAKELHHFRLIPSQRVKGHRCTAGERLLKFKESAQVDRRETGTRFAGLSN